MPSKARKSLDANLEDVVKLLALHAEKGGNSPGRRYGLEVLNKSAIVLLTAFWEAYCEDIAEEAVHFIVEHATSASALPKEIRKIVASRLKQDPNELAIWDLAGEGWREVLKANLAEQTDARNRKLNTPKSSNINELFQSTIGLPEVTGSWDWARKLVPAQQAARLDKFVSLRGAIAHRGRADVSVKRTHVVNYLGLIQRAARSTGGAVRKHVRLITGKNLWPT